MRNVKYGRFVDFMPPMDYDDDNFLIGGHRYIRHAQEQSLRTAGYEYYIEKEGQLITIQDATILEKALARMKFVFKGHKKRVLGERTFETKKVNPYSGPIQKLGVKLDEKGNEVVDKAYFVESEKEALARGDREAARAVVQKRNEAEESIRRIQKNEQDDDLSR